MESRFGRRSRERQRRKRQAVLNVRTERLLPAGACSLGDAAAGLNSRRRSRELVNPGSQATLGELVSCVSYCRCSSQSIHARIARPFELEVGQSNLISGDQLAVSACHAEPCPLAHTVEQHFRPSV